MAGIQAGTGEENTAARNRSVNSTGTGNTFEATKKIYGNFSPATSTSEPHLRRSAWLSNAIFRSENFQNAPIHSPLHSFTPAKHTSTDRKNSCSQPSSPPSLHHSQHHLHHYQPTASHHSRNSYSHALQTSPALRTPTRPTLRNRCGGGGQASRSASRRACSSLGGCRRRCCCCWGCEM